MPVFSVVERPAPASHLREGEVPACPRCGRKMYSLPDTGGDLRRVVWVCWTHGESPSAPRSSDGEEVIPVAISVTEATNHSVEAIPPAPALGGEDLLSVREAAISLGISESAIHWHLSKRRMEASKKRNMVYIPRSAVEAFRAELPSLRRGVANLGKGHKPDPSHPWTGRPLLEPKAVLAPTLTELLETHTAATSRYLGLHAEWQAAAARERELRDQVAQAEAAQQEASERLGAGLAAMKEVRA